MNTEPTPADNTILAKLTVLQSGMAARLKLSRDA
jgi:hypothetical protein